MSTPIRNNVGGYANDPFASPGMQASWTERLRHSKALIPTFAVLLVAVAALGATLVVSHTRADDAVAMNAPSSLPSTAVDPIRSPGSVAPGTTAALTQPTPVPTSPVMSPRVPTPPTAPVAVAAAPVAAPCASCGVVESVVAVERTQKPSGVGAIGGAVVGGLVGNQFGGGSGRTAMTLLGAAGGGYAGNAIEKNMHRYTVYETRVRMEDGTLRTFERSTRLATGSRVTVEGHTLRAA